MTFSRKLTLGILLLLCLTLSLGGAWTIDQNLQAALLRAQTQNTAFHQRERSALEQALRADGADSSITAARSVQAYAKDLQSSVGAQSFYFSVMDEGGTTLYSSLPSAVQYSVLRGAIAAGPQSVTFCYPGPGRYMVLASPLQGSVEGLWLVSVYDITALYTERERQVGQYLVLEVTALVLAGAAAALFSRRMTRPLRALQAAARSMAEGAYDRRVPPCRQAEFDALGQDFNRMAAAVESRVDALRQESQRQTRFVAAFTHELKTPMTSILGYADLLRMGEQPPERRRQAADYIYHESKRLETLSRQLLQLLGLQQGGIDLSPVAVRLVFADVRRSLPEDFPAVIRTECDPAAVVLADRPLLGDLLRNLVLNAANAGPRDGVVHLACTRREGGWEISVTDTGCGMAAQELPRITEAFYMVDKSRARRAGGSGLGLSLCAEIARAHGTALTFESEPGKGTTVRILLKEGTE